MSKDISIVVPVYNEEESLDQLNKKLREALSKSSRSFEIIFVDDGSVDQSPKILENLHAQHDDISVVQLRRNSGKSAG